MASDFSDKEAREIFIPHQPAVTAVTAVKNVLLQASLAQLHAKELYERYLQFVDPEIPEQIRLTLAMNWMPVEVAHVHYEACENMMLRDEQVQSIGAHVGVKLQATSLVTAAKKSLEATVDLWAEVRAVHRMWARYYQGGSAQIVKLGSKEMLVELLGFSLHKYRYYRQGQLAVVAASFEAVQARLLTTRIDSYSAARDELVLRFTWL